MKQFFVTIFLSLLLGFTGFSAVKASNLVKKIKAMNLTGVTITEVEEVPAGNFTPQGGKKLTNLPAFLRVAFTSKPTPESNIRNELWMPKDTWNGRFLGTGNGGGAGKINYGPLISGVIRGFATANTDMGTSPNADDAVNHPERWADFGYRSTHEMTSGAKAILQVFYKKPASKAYFIACSTGGQQALMEAQRFPDDYNGIIAGAPANNRTHLHTFFIWNLIANNQGQPNEIISQKKISLFSKLVIQYCVGKDGGAPGDGFLTDPRLCDFKFETLPQCSEGIKTDSCFTMEDINALKKLYAGPTNPRTGNRIYTPLPLGGSKLELSAAHLYLFKWVFGKEFDYRKFDFDHEMAIVDSILGPLLNANNPDLSPIKSRGGKILMYTGTDDQLVPAQDAINYYERVIEAQGGLKQTQDFFRFFLIPGMGHCGGGSGLNFREGKSIDIVLDSDYDILSAMVKWVENGIAPDKFNVKTFNCCDSINRIGFQRPIYPYPKFPDYVGGDPNVPSSYKGKDHQRGGVLAPAPVYLK